MTEQIYITCPDMITRAACDYIISQFTSEFNYLRDIEVIFSCPELYDQYNNDVKFIRSGKIPLAMIIDSRGLKGHEGESVRLLVTEFLLGQENGIVTETILHELGHYFTNLKLIDIRQHISDLKKKFELPLEIGKDENLCKKHNDGILNLLQILNLSCEISAELWIYEHEKDICLRILERSCKLIKAKLSQYKNAKVEKDFFYEIAGIHFLILLRLAVLKHIESDFKEKCISDTNKLYEVLITLAKQTGWGGLKQLKYHDKILEVIEYKKHNADKILGIFEEIYAEYIEKSSTFFNKSQGILDFYNS